MSIQTNAERREDAHRKILLGGLVVKAGLDKHSRAFILGALITAAEQYADPRFRDAMIAKGQKAFDK